MHEKKQVKVDTGYKSSYHNYYACVKLAVDLMFDDHPEIVLYLAEHGIRAFMMAAPYNP